MVDGNGGGAAGQRRLRVDLKREAGGEQHWPRWASSARGGVVGWHCVTRRPVAWSWRCRTEATVTREARERWLWRLHGKQQGAKGER